MKILRGFRLSRCGARPRFIIHRAVLQPSTLDDDFRLAECCLAGNREALEKLRELCGGWVRSYLVRSGASASESGAIVENLLTDCVVPMQGENALLATFTGQCPLRAWLCRVALNRLISLKRAALTHARRFGDEPMEEKLAEIADDRADPVEEPVLRLVRDAIARAFKECDREHFVILQLLHSDELHLEEVARMLDCSVATVSRQAEEARTMVREGIVKNLRATDPWLQLNFEDLLEICRTVLPRCFGVK